MTISTCQVCNFQTTDPNKLRKHKKKEHTNITSKQPGTSAVQTLDPGSMVPCPVSPSNKLLSKTQALNDVSMRSTEKVNKFVIHAPLNVLPATPTTTSSFDLGKNASYVTTHTTVRVNGNITNAKFIIIRALSVDRFFLLRMILMSTS